MKKPLAAAVAAAVIAIPVVFASPAQAGAEWNDYATTLPKYVTGPTPFEVTVDGPDAVCSMTYNGTTLTAAPWVFTYAPSDDMWADVDITTCSGSNDYADVVTQSAFDVRGQFIYNGEWENIDTVSVSNNMNVPATVTVTNPKGEVVNTAELAPFSEADVKVPVKGIKSTSVFTITMSGANGLTQTQTVVAPKGWTPLMDNSGAAFAPCSTLKWSYNPSGAPKNASKVRQDIEGSFNRLSKVTGLKFVYTDNPADADITYSWENMGKGGPAGTGGYSWSSNSKSKGRVDLNSKNYWTTDKYLGFASGKRANGYGPAGRGWLLVHETMHALGFGHVGNESSIMAPINRGQSKFTKGDVEGLQTLYPKAGCAA